MTLNLPFAWVDVFADTPLAGNPLPVVWDSAELSETAMRDLAREFTQSETTFVLPPTQPGADRRLRSFTPTGAEVTGAGHNTLGAWWVLADTGQLDLPDGLTTLQQEIGGQTLPVGIEVEAGRPKAIRQFQSPAKLYEPLEELGDLPGGLGLDAADFVTEPGPQVVYTGAAHLMVPVTDRAAVDRAAPDAPRLRELLAQTGGQGCYLFAKEPQDAEAHAYARFFNPTVGIWEDPATGSAAGPLAAYLVAHEAVETGRPVHVEQGHLMGRPSRLTVYTGPDGIALAGRCVVIAEGRLRLSHAQRIGGDQ